MIGVKAVNQIGKEIKMLMRLPSALLLISSFALMFALPTNAQLKSQATGSSLLPVEEETLLELDPDLKLVFFPTLQMQASPDGKRLALTAQRQGKPVLLLDGKESPPFQEFAYGAFSPDSQHYACAIKRGGKWFMMIDGKEQEESGLGAPIFSPDSKRLAHWKARAGRWVVVVDGKEEAAEFEKPGQIAFSPDSRRLAYAGKKVKGKWVIVADGKEGPELEEALFLVFSPDSKRLAYAARQGGWRIVVDGKQSLAFRSVTRPVFSPDSQRLAYLVIPAKLEHKINVTVVHNLAGVSPFRDVWAPVVDDQMGEPNLIFAGPIFSPDSKQAAYAAGDHVQSTLFIGGQKIQDFSERKKGRLFLVRSLVFSPDGKRWACALSEGGHMYMNTIAQVGSEWSQAQRRVVVDGQEGPEYDIPGMVNLRFSPDSQHLAYEAQGMLNSWVMVDGREGKHYDQVLWGTLFFSSNDSVTYVAREARKFYRVRQSVSLPNGA